MPTTAEILQLLLGGMTGRAVAGVQPPGAFAGYGNVQGTPPFVPSPAGVGPAVGGGMPQLPAPNLPQLPIPGDPGSGALALPPSAPIDTAALLERARAAASGILGPEQAPTPQKRPSILSMILQTLAQGTSAALSRDPGATLADFQRQALALKQNEIERTRQDKERRQALTSQIFRGSVDDATIERRQRDADARLNERQFQADIRDDQRNAANQAALDYREERRLMAAETAATIKAKQDEAKATLRQQLDDEKAVRMEAARILDDFKGSKTPISLAQAERLAGHRVLGTKLSAVDEKIYNTAVTNRSLGSNAQGVPAGKVREKLAQFETLKGAMAAAQARGDDKAVDRLRGRLETLGAQMPSTVEFGFDPTGFWPYAKIRGTNPGAPAQRAASPAAESPARAGARQKLKANGYTDAEATAELDRLGVR